LFVFFLLTLAILSCGQAFADTLQVDFTAQFSVQTKDDEIVSGSFLWDTVTGILSEATISSTGTYTFLPSIAAAGFAPLGNTYNYPVGSLTFFAFLNGTQTVVFQLNYGDHAFLDPPVVPDPGVYVHVPFDIGGSGVGRNVAGTGEIMVTETPELSSAALLFIGAAILLISLRKHRAHGC
jgi:hypothetical protein